MMDVDNRFEFGFSLLMLAHNLRDAERVTDPRYFDEFVDAFPDAFELPAEEVAMKNVEELMCRVEQSIERCQGLPDEPTIVDAHAALLLAQFRDLPECLIVASADSHATCLAAVDFVRTIADDCLVPFQRVGGKLMAEAQRMASKSGDKAERDDEPTDAELSFASTVLAKMTAKNPTVEAFRMAARSAGLKASNRKLGTIFHRLRETPSPSPPSRGDG